MEKLILAVASATVATSAFAGGGWNPSSVSVPVDSPMALLGLAVAVSLVAVRVLKNRQK
jgi:hypothetical protein